MGYEDIVRKNLQEIRSSWEVVTREALNRDGRGACVAVLASGVLVLQ